MDYQDYSDSELFSLVCEANEEAKDVLYHKYHYIIDVLVKKYLYSAKKLGYEYKDLEQEAMVGFADSLNHYDESKNAGMPTFISLCVERRLQNAISKAGRLKNKILLESLSLDHVYDNCQVPLKEMISDQNSDPLQGITKDEELEELVDFIKDSLSASEYEVYDFLINGLNYQEIAQILEKSPKQIDNTIQRLKGKIKTILQEKRN